MEENLTPFKDKREYCIALNKLLRRTSNPKLGLARARALLERVGFDRTSMRIIQVVGTNGKGSTVASIEALLRANGISCGLFTSPHLCSARERIRINGEMISERDFVRATEHVLSCAQSLEDEASFFECIFAMAMWLFQEYKVDVAILEAGLGGRLDATTAADADVLGITSIDLDHQNILGETHADIAREKISAARHCQPVVSVVQSDEAMAAINDVCATIGCSLSIAEESQHHPGLLGAHQRINAGLAEALVEKLGIKCDDPEAALKKVNWPGRFEIIPHAIPIVIDGAHNPAGMQALVQCLKTYEPFSSQDLMVVYGSLGGANAETKIRVLKDSGLPIRHVFFHQSANARALNCDELARIFNESGFSKDQCSLFISMDQVKGAALKAQAAIVVCGSLYSVGEIRGELLSIEIDRELPIF